MQIFCCSNCFKDPEIKGYIITNSTTQGNCKFCNTSNTELIDALELSDMFQVIIDAYEVDVNYDELQEDLLDVSYFLVDRLILDWPKLFRIDNRVIIKSLLEAICLNEQNAEVFNKPVKISYIPDQYQEMFWDKFVEEVKHENRFFLKNTINLELLAILFAKNVKYYKKGKLFYRARISFKDGFSISDMGKPPANKAVAGRANPKGISYLYISNNIETTLYETRAALHDFVTVGEFKLIDDIKVLNLRNTQEASPLLLEDAIGDYLIHKRYLSRLEGELSNPVRRQDSELDYLPTQYLCEFVKSLGYDGVGYKSSLNPEGFNLAIFSDTLFECKGVKTYEVRMINYDFTVTT